MAFIMKNVRSRVQSSLEAAASISDISKASEAVITVNNSYSAGDFVVLKAMGGMVEMRNRVVRVKSPTATEFVAEGLDSTNFTDYTSGGTAEKVTGWETFDNIGGLNFNDNPAQKQDATPINAKSQVEINGLKGSSSATFDVFSDPLGLATEELRKASDADTERVFEFTFLDEGFTVFCYAEVSGGNALSASAGGVVSGGSVELTLKHIQQYVST